MESESSFISLLVGTVLTTIHLLIILMSVSFALHLGSTNPTHSETYPTCASFGVEPTFLRGFFFPFFFSTILISCFLLFPCHLYLVYPVYQYGPCPASHNVRIPTLRFESKFKTQIYNGNWSTALNTSQPFVVSNGDSTGYGYHADFVDGWNKTVLKEAIAVCVSNFSLRVFYTKNKKKS